MGVKIRRMNGDGLYANENTPSAGSAMAWPTDIWFHDSSIDSVGRNAFTINSGRRVTLERNVIDHVGGSVLDIEPDLDTQGAVDLILRNNTVGAWGLRRLYDALRRLGQQRLRDRAPLSAASTSGAIGWRMARPTAPTLPTAGGLLTSIRKSRTSDVTFIDNSTTKAGRRTGAPLRSRRRADRHAAMYSRSRQAR